MRHAAVPALVHRDDRVPLLLTLFDEQGDEIDSATATDGDAAVRMAIRLLERTQTLRPNDRGAGGRGGRGRGEPQAAQSRRLPPSVRNPDDIVAHFGRRSTSSAAGPIPTSMASTSPLTEIKTGKPVVTGNTFARVSYDIPGLAHLPAKGALCDSEDRAAKLIADNVRTRLASYFVAGT
jgi:hypothetical protein